jgi:hypothetical protein
VLRQNVLGILAGLLLIGLVNAYASRDKTDSNKNDGKKPKKEIIKIELKSDAFAAGDSIPKKYTCDGEDVSPRISWGKAPEGTKEFALICDDPDAPGGNWVHWVLFGLSPRVVFVSENMPREEMVSVKQGKNSFGKIGYNGPCPPKGPAHRYYFRLYALDKKLELKQGATKDEIMKAIKGHIIAKGELMGRYGRSPSDVGR